MNEFALLKQEEVKVLDAQLRDRDAAIDGAEEFEKKRSGLEIQIGEIKGQSDNDNAKKLRAEAEKLDMEIRQLEEELLQMKAQYRRLVDKANQTESAMQSRLSSFNASLGIVDSEIARFLKRPPIEQSLQIPGFEASVEDFYALHPQRRTLAMAKDHWQEEKVIIQRRKEDVEAEKEALNDGSGIWRQVTEEINAFEKLLREQTQKLSQSQGGGAEDMSRVLARMDNTMEFLERQFQHAQDRGWNLLVCCVGAELEAFREGKSLLVNTLGLVQEGEEHALQGEELTQYSGATNGAVANGSNESLNDTLREMTAENADSRPAGPPPAKTQIDSRSESEDDDPGPAFLISHA